MALITIIQAKGGERLKDGRNEGAKERKKLDLKRKVGGKKGARKKGGGHFKKCINEMCITENNTHGFQMRF